LGTQKNFDHRGQVLQTSVSLLLGRFRGKTFDQKYVHRHILFSQKFFANHLELIIFFFIIKIYLNIRSNYFFFWKSRTRFPLYVQQKLKRVRH
jgi:hypothetical protein